MTLVAALTILDTPVLVGDILISHRGSDRAAGLPTRLDAGTLMHPEYAIAGVKRKLSVLHDRLVVGWAGSELGAQSVIRDLRSLARGSRLDRECLFAFLREGHDLGHGAQCGLVGWLVDDRGPLAFRWDSASGRVDSGAHEYATGTGEADFMREVHAVHSGNVDPRLTPPQQVLQVALMLAGNALGREVFAGETLGHAYGGALEVAVFADGRFEVVSDIGFLFWGVQIDVERESLDLAPGRTIMKYFHADDCLIVYTVRNGEAGELTAREFHIVTPVDHAGGAVPDISVFTGFASAQAALYCNVFVVPVPGFGGIMFALVLPEPNEFIRFSREIRDGEVRKEWLDVNSDFGRFLYETLEPRVKALRSSAP